LTKDGLGIAQRAQFGNLPLGGDAIADGELELFEGGARLVELSVQIGERALVPEVHPREIALRLVEQ
jgi:hypothetical protein